MLMETFEEILSRDYHITLHSNSRMSESIKLSAEKYAAQFISEQKPLTPNIERALINLEEYFEGKADADYEFNDIDGRYIPNEEMGLLNDVQVIKKYFGID